MAKAKTPSTGGDKPTSNLTSRASVATAKPKTTTPKAATKSPAKTEAASKPAKADVKKPAPAKAEQEVTTSVAPDAKKDVALKANASKIEGTKPEATAEAKPTVETATPTKEAEKKADPVKQTQSEKPDEAPTKATPPATPAPVQAAPQKNGSVFFPMLLGGIVAGGIGFAAAEMNVLELRSDAGTDTTVQFAFEADLAAQDARIETLEQAPTETSDITPIQTALDEVAATVAALSSRIDEIENRPAPTAGEAPQVDTSAFEAELATLKSSVETQRDEIQTLLENALSVEEATAQAAQAATAQSAIARIVAAITTGQPFAAEVAALQANDNVDVPSALADIAETGVATAANLQDRFPDAARAALSAARANAPAEAQGGFGSFLKNQLGARSVTPREGSDPDAVLSRAEAAVRDGRLADALTEVAALPEAAKAPLADWIADAQTRQAAQDAVDTLTQRLTAN